MSDRWEAEEVRVVATASGRAWGAALAEAVMALALGSHLPGCTNWAAGELDGLHDARRRAPASLALIAVDGGKPAAVGKRPVRLERRGIHRHCQRHVMARGPESDIPCRVWCSWNVSVAIGDGGLQTCAITHIT